MRIWLAPSAYFPAVGGVETATARLAEELTHRGHDVLVVTHRWPSGTPDDDLVDGVAVRRVDFGELGRHPGRWRQQVLDHRAARRVLEALPVPDVVHVHCVAGQALPVARYCTRRGIPLVLTTHGETAMDERQVFQRSPLRRRALRQATQVATHLTACSDWTRRHAATYAPRFADAMVIQNGVDLDTWRGLPMVTEPVFAAYGRHAHQKGFDVLLDAFGLLRERLPEARLLLGGEGSQTPVLRAAAGPGVSFTGRLDVVGVRKLLSKSRVVVVPSRIEPFGLVALEALAAERRLVYSAVGGLAEIGRGRGWAATADDPAQLAAAMHRAHLEAPRGADAAELQREYSWDAVSDKYLTLYARGHV